MLLSAAVAILFSTISLPQLFLTASAATDFCAPLTNSSFQWLDSNGSLVLPHSYAAPQIPQQRYQLKPSERALLLSPACSYYATRSDLVCRDDNYTVPDPASLPVTNLTTYRMSGGLAHLPPRSFAGLSIQQLVIEDTNLTLLGEETFTDIRFLKFLFLRNNSFLHLNDVSHLFRPLHSLKGLSLGGNSIRTLFSFGSAWLQKLEYLSFKGNILNDFNFFFLQYSGLKFLDLRFTHFTENVTHLDDSGLALLPTTLTSVDFSHASISVKCLGKFLTLLNKANITTLNLGHFRSTPWLLFVLKPIRNSLQFLSFEGTDLSIVLSVSTDTQNNYVPKVKPFSRLTELNLKKCQIKFLGNIMNEAFPNLKVLSLAENSITNLNMMVFINMPSLNFLDLTSNVILELSSGHYNETADNVKFLDLSSAYISLDDNLSQILFNSFPNLEKLSLCNAKFNSSTPDAIKSLQHLKYLDLTATLPNAYYLMPNFVDLFMGLNSPLTDLIFSKNNFKPSSDCITIFSFLKSLKTLDLSNNLIRDISQDLLLPSVDMLDLSQNLITTWYSKIMSDSHPKFLDLSNNQVTYVSEAMVHDFYKLKFLDLSNNPLMCHNKVVAMVCADVKNETHNLTMVSGKMYKCYDVVSNNYRLFSDPEQCDEYYEEVSTQHNEFEVNTPQSLNPLSSSIGSSGPKYVNYFITLLLVSSATFCAVIVCIIYFKWWSIKCYIHRYFSLRRAHLLRKEGALLVKPNIHYDVFVSYSDVDRSWIFDHLLPNMEADGDISLCFHERDFQVGLSILENIIECMDRSHTILLVVSSAFVRSKWCQFEMHLAQFRLIETLRDQLVLVLLEDVPKKSRPQILHHLMMTKTYLVWPTQPCKEDTEELFWKRLKRALIPNLNHIYCV